MKEKGGIRVSDLRDLGGIRRCFSLEMRGIRTVGWVRSFGKQEKGEENEERELEWRNCGLRPSG